MKNGNKLVNTILDILAMVAAIATLVLCFYSMNKGTVLVKTEGDPGASVRGFYDAIVACQYSVAYEYMDGYSSLGLENAGATPESDLLMDALRKNYSYTLNGGMSVDGRTATQSVTFTSIDLDRLEADTATRIDEILNEKVQELSRDEIYDDNGDYKESLLEETYMEALNDSLEHVENFTTSVTYDVTLRYDGEKWLIEYSDDLMKGLSGGK